jgi:hypothetical protein
MYWALRVSFSFPLLWMNDVSIRRQIDEQELAIGILQLFMYLIATANMRIPPAI